VACGGDTGHETGSFAGESGGRGGTGDDDPDAAAPSSGGGGAEGMGGGLGTGGQGVGGAPGSGGQGAVCTFTIGAGWDYMGAEVTCEIPIDAPEPCWEAALCMCTADTGLPPDSDETVRCANSLFEIRGSTTLFDACWTRSDEEQLTLGQAVASYAEAYGTTATTSPECEDVTAYFE